MLHRFISDPYETLVHRLSTRAENVDLTSLDLLLFGEAAVELTDGTGGRSLLGLIADRLHSSRFSAEVRRAIVEEGRPRALKLADNEVDGLVLWFTDRFGVAFDARQRISAAGLLLALLTLPSVERILADALPNDHVLMIKELSAMALAEIPASDGLAWQADRAAESAQEEVDTLKSSASINYLWPEVDGNGDLSAVEATQRDVAAGYLGMLGRHAEDAVLNAGRRTESLSDMIGTLVRSVEFRDRVLSSLAAGSTIPHSSLSAIDLQFFYEWLRDRVHAPDLGRGVLAPSFSQFIGYDISEPHLELARQYLAQENVANARLEHLHTISDITIPPHDFFYSRIVLQHNPPPVQKYLLNAVLSRLRGGGVAVFQVVTAIEGYSFIVDDYLQKMDGIDSQELHVLPQKDIFEVIHTNGCVPVDVARETSIRGFDRVSTVFTVQRQQI